MYSPPRRWHGGQARALICCTCGGGASFVLASRP